MKKIIIALSLFLIACSPDFKEAKSETLSLENVKGLEDCKFIEINTLYRNYEVIRCPNSSTTTQYTISQGKTTETIAHTVVETS